MAENIILKFIILIFWHCNHFQSKNWRGYVWCFVIGHIKTLDSFCAVKGFEARVLQSLAGCEYFPYAFGEFDGKLVMELITCEDKKVVTVSSMQKENKLTSAGWNVICFSLASAVKYMHLLHNDLKSNNILLKLRNNVWIPKFADIGKVTLKSNPETYKLSKHAKGPIY